MAPAIATVGSLVVDLIVPIPELPVRPFEHQAGETLWVEPGGLGNVLVTAARLGMQAAALGWAGDDFYGERALALLAGEGVDVSRVERVGSSRVCLVLVDSAGRHVFLGVAGLPGPERVPQSWRTVLRGVPWVLSDGYTLVANPDLALESFALARDAGGVTTVFDPGPLIPQTRPSVMATMLRDSSIVLLTEDEAAMLVERGAPAQMAQALLARGPRLVCLKRGAQGAVVATPADTFSQPAFPVQVRDTSGAGDAFDAAFIAGLANGLGVRQAVSLANGVGAVAVSKLGTGTRLPTREEVFAFLKTQGVRADDLLPRA